ncbi:alpha/beta hydrolase [Permianibacter sp. IMCC34836]|nr:alpha/beta hydrolase [Permianibacter fluminis]
MYLPPGYDDSKATYPVLYLLDGGVDEDFIHIAGIASLAADWRNIREFIVIGVASLDRYHELDHPSAVPAEQQRWPTAGGSAQFREFLAKELIPYVQQHFRVSDESVLMGESAAGLFVTETFLRQPALFNGYIAISPSLWWDGQSLAKAAPGLLATANLHNKRLYLALGDEGGEMEDGVNKLVAAVKAAAPADFHWSYTPMPQESHSTIYHPAALAALRQFFVYPPR